MFFDNNSVLPEKRAESESILYEYAQFLNKICRSTSSTRRERKLLKEKEMTFMNAFSSAFSKEIASGKAYWWRLQWDQIAPRLQANTTFGESENGWQFQNQWEIVGDNEERVLILRELGNCPEFSYEKTTEHDQLSPYSAVEQEEMRSNYNKALDRYALNDVLFNDTSPVRSPVGKIYASRADYYLSEEYLNERWWSDWNYSRSLYVEHEKNTMVIKSKSRYYQAAYAVARFYSDGVIQSLQLYPFQWCGGAGDVPQFARTRYSNRDPAIAFVQYVESHPECGILPVSLFSEGLMKESKSYEDAIRLAQIMCCIGNRISP